MRVKEEKGGGRRGQREEGGGEKETEFMPSLVNIVGESVHKNHCT
jgi:hypothetical protein